MMRMQRIIKYAETAVGIFALFVALGASFVHAQGPLQLALTWQADNSYPSDYPLKADATGNTPVTVSLAGLRDGKFADLSQTNIAWWRDGSYFGGGIGMTSIVFNVEWRYKRPGTSYLVRAIATYNGTRIDTAISIPVAAQRVVLQTPYLNNQVPKGSIVTVTAVPYFFNIGGLGDLTFQWTINGQLQPAQTGQNVATVTIANDTALVGSYVPVSVQATNMAKLEQATAMINLAVQ